MKFELSWWFCFCFCFCLFNKKWKAVLMKDILETVVVNRMLDNIFSVPLHSDLNTAQTTAEGGGNAPLLVRCSSIM